MRTALPTDDGVLLFGLDAGHRLVDHLAAVRPVVAVVRIVGAPHHVLHTDLVTVADGVVVTHEGTAHVRGPVARRRPFELEVGPAAVAPVAIVHRLEEVREPPHADLDHADVQVRESVEDAREDQLTHRRRHGREHARQAGRGLGTGATLATAVELAPPGLRRGLTGPHARLAADHVDVDAHRHPLVLCRRPERVVLVADRLAPCGPARDHHRFEPTRLGLANAIDRGVDPDRRDLGRADQSSGVRGAELVGEEVVVRLDAGEHEVVVLVAEEVADRALGWEQHLGVDAVLGHVVEPRRAVVATGACFVVRDALPPELVPRHARRGGQPDRIGFGGAGEQPGVAALAVLHQLRRLVPVALGQPVRPDVGRLQDVGVRRDDRVLRCAVRHAVRTSGAGSRRCLPGQRHVIRNLTRASTFPSDVGFLTTSGG